MIKEFFDADKFFLFEYIGDDFGRCPYIYIDLKKYSLEGCDFRAWAQTNDSGKICAIVTEYFKGYQVYSKENDLDKNELIEFLKNEGATVIFGVKGIMDGIKTDFPDYIEKIGVVGELKSLRLSKEKKACHATEKDIKDIVEMLVKEKGNGEAYGYDSLYRQYTGRLKDGTGRSFVLKNDVGRVICHAGTCAETEDMAVVGGVITDVEYRGKGYAKSVLASLCSELLSEGKRVFSFFYVPAAKKMHYVCGFEDVDEWIKLQKMDI